MTANNCSVLDCILQNSSLKPQKKGNKVLINPCPVCGHKDHFYVYPNTDSYYSFADCCKGGSMVDWLMEYDGLTLEEAMKRVKGNIQESAAEKAMHEENRRLAELLNKRVEDFYDTCVQKYQLFLFTETECRAGEVEYVNPFYRWIRQGLRFYDRVTDEFINGDFEKHVQLMQNHKSEYFFKLHPEVTTHV